MWLCPLCCRGGDKGRGVESLSERSLPRCPKWVWGPLSLRRPPLTEASPLPPPHISYGAPLPLSPQALFSVSPGQVTEPGCVCKCM